LVQGVIDDAGLGVMMRWRVVSRLAAVTPTVLAWRWQSAAWAADGSVEAGNSRLIIFVFPGQLTPVGFTIDQKVGLLRICGIPHRYPRFYGRM
jgi:hypothetical protein